MNAVGDFLKWSRLPFAKSERGADGTILIITAHAADGGLTGSSCERSA